MNKNMKKISSLALMLSMLAPNFNSAVSALDSRENPGTQNSEIRYKDGKFTGYGRGYYATINGGDTNESKLMRMDVTIENGEIKSIEYTPDGDGYEYPDDKGQGLSNYKGASSKIIDIIKSGKDPYKVTKDLSDHITNPRANPLDTKYDTISGATYSARGVAEAVTDALNKSRLAAESETKVINSMTVLDGPNKRPFVGDNIDLTTFRVQLNYSDNTAEQVSYSDFASKGLKLFLKINRGAESEIHGNTYQIEKGATGYNFVIKKDGESVTGTYDVVSVTKFLYEKNLFYKIGDGEYREISPINMYSKENGKKYAAPNSDQNIEISREDIGKQITFKTTQYYDLYDNIVENVEYEYTPVTISEEVIEEGYFEIQRKGQVAPSEVVNNKKFESGSFYINVSVSGEDSDTSEDSSSVNEEESSSGDSDRGESTPVSEEVPTDESVEIKYFKYIPYFEGEPQEQMGGKVEAQGGKFNEKVIVKAPSPDFEKYKMILSYVEDGETKEVSKDISVIPEGVVVFDLGNSKRVGVRIEYFRPLLKSLKYALVDDFQTVPNDSDFKNIELPDKSFFDGPYPEIYRTEIQLPEDAVGKYIKYKYEFVNPDNTDLEMYTKKGLENSEDNKIKAGDNSVAFQTYSEFNSEHGDTYTYALKFVAQGEVEEAPNEDLSNKTLTDIEIIEGPDKKPYVGENMDVSSLKVRLKYDNSALYTETVSYSDFESKGLKVYVKNQEPDSIRELNGNTIYVDTANKQYNLIVKKGDSIVSPSYNTVSRYKYLYEKNLMYSIDGSDFVEISDFKMQDSKVSGENYPRPDSSQDLTIKKSDIGKTIRFKTTKYFDAVTGREYNHEYLYTPFEITEEMVNEHYFEIAKKGKVDTSSNLEGKKFDLGSFFLELDVVDDQSNGNTSSNPSQGGNNSSNPKANTGSNSSSSGDKKAVPHVYMPTTSSKNDVKVDKNSDLKDILKSSTRISGLDRYETSVEISKKTFDKSDYVVLVNGHQSVDVLSAIPLANLRKAPILLVKRDQTPESVKSEIKRLGAKNIIVIGGENSVSKKLDILSNSDYKVQSISGEDRYHTSRLISDEVKKLNGNTEDIVIVNAKNPVDALSLSSMEKLRTAPVLLVDSEKIEKQTNKFISEAKEANIHIFGGENSISSKIEKNLSKSSSVKRYSGNDRYETSVNIAKNAAKKKEVIIASGENYADAMTVSSYANKRDTLLVVLKDGDSIKDISNLLKDKGVEKITIVGGEESLKID